MHYSGCNPKSCKDYTCSTRCICKVYNIHGIPAYVCDHSRAVRHRISWLETNILCKYKSSRSMNNLRTQNTQGWYTTFHDSTTIPVKSQSTILVQSWCNPKICMQLLDQRAGEYRTRAERPCTSVNLLRSDSRIAPQMFQDVSTRCAACRTLQQPSPENSTQVKDKNAVYNRNTVNNPTSFFVQSLTSKSNPQISMQSHHNSSGRFSKRIIELETGSHHSGRNP